MFPKDKILYTFLVFSLHSFCLHKSNSTPTTEKVFSYYLPFHYFTKLSEIAFACSKLDT